MYENQATLNVRFKTLTMRLGIKPINCSQKNSNLNEISPLSLILMQTNTDKHFFAKSLAIYDGSTFFCRVVGIILFINVFLWESFHDVIFS